MGVDICVLLLAGGNGFLCPLSSDTTISPWVGCGGGTATRGVPPPSRLSRFVPKRDASSNWTVRDGVQEASGFTGSGFLRPHTVSERMFVGISEAFFAASGS